MTPLRKRLWYPPNAVPDTGIDLRRQPDNILPFRPKDISKPPYRGPDTMGRLIKNDSHYPIDALEHASRSENSRLLVMDVMKTAAEVFGVSVFAFQQNRRDMPLATYRQAAIALACHLTLHSLPHIGRCFSREHTTVLHAKRKMQPHIDAVAAELPLDAPVIKWAWAMRRRLDIPRARAKRSLGVATPSDLLASCAVSECRTAGSIPATGANP